LAERRFRGGEIRWLIWIYFFLLIFEGALRKWIAPSLANVLLVVRDPVLLAIYAPGGAEEALKGLPDYRELAAGEPPALSR